MLLSYSLISRLYYILLIIVAVFLPSFRLVTSYAIAGLIILWFIEADFRRKYLRILQSPERKYLILGAGFYILFLVGLIHTSNMDQGLENLQVKLPLLVFPLVLSTMDKDYLSKKRIHHILIAFSVSTILISLYSVLRSAFRYFEDGDASSFFYSEISYLNHTSYYSIFEVFSICVLLYFLVQDFEKMKLLAKSGMLFLIAFMMLFTVLLSSKAGIISLFGVFMIAAIWVLLEYKNWKASALLFFAPLISILFLLSVLDGAGNRFVAATNDLNRSEEIQPAEETRSTAARMLIWEDGIELFAESPVFGYGTGDAKDELLEQYIENNHKHLHEGQLNAHNTFLETSLAIGVLGLLMLILILMLPLFLAFRDHYFLMMAFIFILSLNFMVESMLKRQDGVVFFAFMMSLLVFGWKRLSLEKD